MDSSESGVRAADETRSALVKMWKNAEMQKNIEECKNHVHNTIEVLVNSNATPIHGHTDSGFSCCFCDAKCRTAAALKQHTLHTHAPNYDMKKATFMRKAFPYSFYVKLDITDLKCKLCNQDIDNLEQLIDHLSEIHELKLYTGINNRILPFKFRGVEMNCFICSSVFVTYKALLEHMNVHYRNFRCEICDAGFVTRKMAGEHTRMHETGTFQCGHCTRVYDTVVKKRNHERESHTPAGTPFKCRLCNEKFKSHYNKMKHLSEVHGVGTRVKCQACDKEYASRKTLRVHMRKNHLMERKHECQLCDMAFFTSVDLKDHVVKHLRLKLLKCDICGKAYSRKRSFYVHMRVHANKQ